jgi:hypothetical protein
MSEVKVTEISYELLEVGDLVAYVDLIPEDILYIPVPGLVMARPGLNQVRVLWLDKALKPGVFLRRELRLLSRAVSKKT